MLLQWVKRFVPFALAFVLGLFVASFFVTVGLPKAPFKRTGKIYRHNHECRMMKGEIHSQRREIQKLRDQLEMRRSGYDFELAVPPPPAPPIPPAAPAAPRAIR